MGDEEGNVKAIEAVKTKLGEFDASGRPPPGAHRGDRPLQCDTVILAVGEAVDMDFVRASGLRIKEETPWRWTATRLKPAAASSTRAAT